MDGRWKRRATLTGAEQAQARRLERAKGIEPSYAAWEAAVLPLNYAREISDLARSRIGVAIPHGDPRRFLTITDDAAGSSRPHPLGAVRISAAERSGPSAPVVV